MICTKFNCNWPAGSGEKKILKKIQQMCTLSLLSPLWEGVVLLLYNSKSPLLKDDMCQLCSGEEVENMKV
jgi:hypothetical protein